MSIASLIVLCIAVALFAFSLFLYFRSIRRQNELVEREKKMQRRMYELAILKELGDRIGYSLNVQNIVDIITGSLHQFIEYSVVSYMLLQPEKIIFKAHLEKSVSQEFVDEVEDRMLKSLSALLNQEYTKSHTEKVISGAVIIEDVREPVRSFFNIPLVIGEKVVGVLTVSSTDPGLYKEEETTILYKITQQASQAVTRLQEVIQTEERKLNAMVESMTEGVVMTDKDYRIAVVNPAAKKVVGIEDKHDITIFDFIENLEGKYDIRGKLEESVKLNKVLVSEKALIHNRYYQIFVAPVKSTNSMKEDEVLGGVVIFHDITHDFELERMREDFTSMMVHELRSPLDGIKKMAHYMQVKVPAVDAKTLEEYLQLIFDSSANMLALVNDLLDVAKIEAGKFELNPVPTDIQALIRDRVSFFEATAREEKITLSAVLDPNLPPQLAIDPTRITQVLNNLISNSLKFTHSGGKITVQALLHEHSTIVHDEARDAGIEWMLDRHDMELSKLPDAVVVAVTDTGEGIAEKNIPGLFNKFVQFQTTPKSREQKGTGLGLVTAKGIVESHHGTIGVASEEGTGTTFYFTIPLGKEPKKSNTI